MQIIDLNNKSNIIQTNIVCLAQLHIIHIIINGSTFRVDFISTNKENIIEFPNNRKKNKTMEHT